MIRHPIEPVYNENSRVLILGSFPSVRSREDMFFYSHSQNRFWKVMADVFECSEPETEEDKRNLLLDHGIALWDVIGYCNVTGSADSSIKNVIPNDLSRILNHARIQRIFLNGKTAEKYYHRYMGSGVGCEAICLPSTSAANASWSREKLVQAWRCVKFP